MSVGQTSQFGCGVCWGIKNILKPQCSVCHSLRKRNCVGQKSCFVESKTIQRGSKIAPAPLKTGLAWVKNRTRHPGPE